MSSLKVLLLGNNPNIILLASRFQLANSVDLYHISDSASNQYEIETHSYGTEKFKLKNHFNTIDTLLDVTNRELFFDLIILCSTSLQELSTVSAQLSPLITNNTKIFLECTGSIQLEPFVRMSINSKHHINVLSIVSDLDIRQVHKDNKFKQFGSSGKPSTIYLGDSSSKTYSSTTQNLLNTFERLFTKLFPHESLNLCDYSSKEFLKVQWELATSQICFDPLLIMLEETNTHNLSNQILAKPLISGLVTEVTSIMNKMGVEFDTSMNSETKLLSHWESLYPTDVPPLVYHFINRTSSMNIDLIWLQIILLADDNNIKTPYLEFLYSMMSQFQKINNDDSKWFARNNGNDSMNREPETKNLAIIDDLNNEKNQLNNEIANLKENIKLKDNKLQQYQDNIEQLKSQLSNTKSKQDQISNEYELQIEGLNKQIQNLQTNQSNAEINGRSYSNDSKIVNKNLTNVGNVPEDYKSTGTPNLNDLEDMAVFGVSYGDSPLRKLNQSQKGDNQPTSSNGSATSQNVNTNSSDSNLSQGEPENESRVLQERELDLKRKELELQERELELQRRALQQQQQQQQYSNRKPKMGMSSNQMPPQQQMNGMNNRNPGYNQMPPQNFGPNMRQNRNLHGATASGPSSVTASNFNDPISSGMGYSGGFPQQQQQQQQQQFHHALKPTSRKNRTSNMPNLRNPSNTNMNSFQGNMMNNVPPSINSQSRLNSLSSQSMNFQNRLRNQQQPNMHSASFNNLNANIRANTMQGMPSNFNQKQFQQRQASSSSVDINNVANLSTNSVVHNQLRPNMSTSNINMMPTSSTMPSLQNQSQQQPQPQQSSQTQTQTQPQTHVPIQLSTPPIPQASFNNNVDASPASFTSNVTSGTSKTTDSEKKKKKKFGFFKKKSKN